MRIIWLLVAVLALAFWAFGAFDMWALLTGWPPYRQQYGEDLLTWIQAYPVWRTTMWGASIGLGLVGSLAMLTRSRLAKDLNVHESTISRATNGKFCQLPNGEIVNFEVFFKPALRVQKMIEEILTYENPSNPLSDERIREMLLEKGVDVARRTVNKYRSRTKMLSSRQRRSA